MFTLIFFFLSCASDHMIAYKVTETITETKHAQDIIIYVEGETVEDTAFDGAPIWVDSFTQPTSVNGVDILWVIDPSGSMSQHQARLLMGIDAMMQALPPSGWRLAIIPSDWRFAESENQFPLVPGDTYEMAENMYNQSRAGAFEAGFDAAYAYMMTNQYSSTWMRNDAALLIVFVSDEREQSNKYLLDSASFIGWASSQRQSVFVASIVNLHPDDSLCNTTVNNHGKKYIEAANYFNGQVVDICSEDWTAGVSDAANQVEPYEEWPLTYEPSDPSHIYVFHDGVPVPDNDGVDTFWHYDAVSNSVIFDKVPSAHVLVEIAYYYGEEEQDTGN